MGTPPESGLRVIGIIVGITVIGIFFSVWMWERGCTGSGRTPTAEAPPPPAPRQVVPPAQEAFCRIVNGAAGEYKGLLSKGANELQLSKVRAARGAALRASLPDGRFTDWLATVKGLHTTGDGNGVLEVALPCAVALKTYNNEFSDIGRGTLIPQSADLYDIVARLRAEQVVRVSGELFADSRDGLLEASVTERGSMTEPEFIVRFSDVYPADGDRPPATNESSNVRTETLTKDDSGVNAGPPPHLGYDRLSPHLRRAVQNATYTFPDMSDTPVTLRNGSAKGTFDGDGPGRNWSADLLDGPWVVTDLNDDGVDDVVVAAYYNGGGSGTFQYLCPIVVDKAGDARVGDLFPVGDRSDLRSLSMRANTLILDYVTHGPDDASCCPTLHTTRAFRYQGGTLIDVPISAADTETVDRPSTVPTVEAQRRLAPEKPGKPSPAQGRPKITDYCAYGRELAVRTMKAHFARDDAASERVSVELNALIKDESVPPLEKVRVMECFEAAGVEMGGIKR